MPASRPVAGFAPPTFDGNSLLNFAATVDAALGGEPVYPLLADQAIREQMIEARHLVVWLIDGLGVEPLQALGRKSLLQQSSRCEINSVFPSSTAPTLTTLMTARSPAAHAVPEWFLWFDELGAIYRSLPLDARDPAGGAAPVSDAATLYPQPSLMSRARRPCFAVLPVGIADSAYSRYAHAGAQVLKYSGGESFLAAITQAIDANRNGSYVYAYLDRFDQVAHEFGLASDKAQAVVRQLDRLFEFVSDTLAARGALLVVTSDHGFIDVPTHLRFHVDALPQIAECLLRPLCGGPRTPFAYVKPERADEFAAIVDDKLGAHFVAVPSEELLDAGWFGPEAPDPRLLSRLGTHILLPKSGAYLVDHMPGEYLAPLLGVHGGTSSAERRVPLILGGTA